jgi:predicted anti-sigma-YlaC factor YlaD
LGFTSLEKFVWMEISRHIEEEKVEGYVMGALAEDAAADVEQHLLVCEACRDRVTEAEAYVLAMKRTTPRMAPHESSTETNRSGWNFRLLLPAFAVFALLLVVVAIRFLPLAGDQTPVAIALVAMRGSDAAAQGPANRPLLLQPDLRGLPAAPAYRIAVVAVSGSIAWQSTLASGEAPGVVAPPQPKGVYFVRVSLPSGELLREYALEVGRN